MTVAVRILRSCLTAGLLIGLQISLRSSELAAAVSEHVEQDSTNNTELLRTAGPSLEQTTQWLKSNLPILAKEAIQRDPDITLRRSIKSAQVTGCTLTILETSRQESEHYGNLTDRTTYTVALADVDLNRLRESQNFLDTASQMKSWSVNIVAMSDRGKPFTYTSPRTPTSTVVLYFAEGEPASRAATALRRVAALCGATLPTSGNWLNPRSKIQNVNAPALRGKYVKRRKPDDYLEIGPDGAFSVQQNGQILSGTYAATGTTVDFHAGPWSGVAVGDEVVDADFVVWERPTPAAAVPAPAVAKAEPGMTNDDVVKLVAAGLDDEVVIAKLRTATRVQFDLTTDALLKLKTQKVSKTVVAAMIERDATQMQPAPPKAAPAIAASQPAPPPPDPCSGIESMGIYTNELMSPQMTQGGLYEWLAKIRNNTGVTKIIRFSWIDEYGQQKASQVQLKGGDIATSRLDLTQKKFIPPVKNLKIVSCQ